MEEANKDLREKVKAMIHTTKDALDRVKRFKAERNKNTLFPSHSIPEIVDKESELLKVNRQVEQKLMEIKRLNKVIGMDKSPTIYRLHYFKNILEGRKDRMPDLKNEVSLLEHQIILLKDERQALLTQREGQK